MDIPIRLFCRSAGPLESGVRTRGRLCLVYPELCRALVKSWLRDRLDNRKRLSKKEMAAEKSNDSSSSDAEGLHGATAGGGDRESTAGIAALEKGNNETRDDDTAGGETKQKEEQQEEHKDEEELVIEQPLLTIKEVFVYQVPPLRASSGHRAEEWGLANPVFTGEWWQADPDSRAAYWLICMVTP